MFDSSATRMFGRMLGGAVLGAVLGAGCVPVSAFEGSEPNRNLSDKPRGVQPQTGPPVDSDEVANVRDFGAVGDGVTDDTAPIQAAIDSLAATGGVVFFPLGQYLVTGQIVLPNDGEQEETTQPPYVFTGVGALFNGRGGSPNGGTILDLRYSQGPKIATYGLGMLEMTGITFADFGDGPGDFILTTNTTLLVHNCAFYGSRPNWQAHSDAIVLGGTFADDKVGGPDPNAPFQGYGTVIRDNYFNRVRRIVYGRVFANAVVVTGNTAWKQCGTNLPDGAAIELHGDPDGNTSQSNGGWYVAGNLIEMRDYAYGIKCVESQRNAFVANNFYDTNQVSQALYRFESSGRLNYVVAGFHEDTLPFVEDLSIGVDRSTVINFHQGQDSIYTQPLRLTNKLLLDGAVDESPLGPRLLSAAGAELTYRMTGAAGVSFQYTPAGGSSTPLWQVKDFGGGVIVQDVQGAQSVVRNLNGSLKVQSATGSPLELGDTSGAGIRVEDGKLSYNSTGVQVFSGSGVPTQSYPNGSLYLRVDGGPGSTLYIREGGAWVAK